MTYNLMSKHMEKQIQISQKNNAVLNRNEWLPLATQLAGAYIQKHPMPIDDIGPIIQKCIQILIQVDQALGPAYNRTARPPAVPIEESVTGDYLVCLEDGKRMRMLKRHLRTMYNMSIEEYKERWGLPNDYPMVAPNYARQRSSIAKNLGLGRVGRKVNAI